MKVRRPKTGDGRRETGDGRPETEAQSLNKSKTVNQACPIFRMRGLGYVNLNLYKSFNYIYNNYYI